MEGVVLTGDDKYMDLDLDEDFDDSVRVGGIIRCVFSSTELMKVGTGTTTRKHASKIYWFAQELGEENFSIRQINTHHVPSGDEKVISLHQLMDQYVPEIKFFEEKTIPAMEQLEEHLKEGEQFRSEGRLYSAEHSFNKALGMDEENVRALFNLGMIYMNLEQLDKAKDMMGGLLHFKSAFAGKNQHLFNEFGILLRKSGLFDEAAEFYGQALNYVKKDENLYYNLARANYERSNWEECVKALEMVADINPTLGVAHKLIGTILTLAEDSELCSKNNKHNIPDHIVRQIGQIPRKKRVSSGTIALSQEDAKRRKKGGSPEVGRARSGSFDDEEE